MVPLSPWSSETKLASCDSPPSLVCGIASSGCERVPLFAGGVLSEKGLLQRKRHQRGSFQTPRHSKPRDLKTSPSSKETNFASNFPDVSLSENPTGKPRDLCPRDAERPPAAGGTAGAALPRSRDEYPPRRESAGAESPTGGANATVSGGFLAGRGQGVPASPGASPLPARSVRRARRRSPIPARGLQDKDVPFLPPSQGFSCPEVVRPA